MNNSQRSTEARKILSSIQKNITKLIDDKHQSIIHSFNHSLDIQSPHDIKPALNILQLESSIRGMESNWKSSRVTDRINKMEQFYVDKIKMLELKVDQLETQKTAMKDKIVKLTQDLLIQKEEKYQLIQELQMQQTNKTKMQSIQSSHLFQVQSFRIELQSKISEQKLLRISFEDEGKRLLQENLFLKQSLKSMSESYKKLLHADMSRMKEEMDQQNKIQLQNEIRCIRDKGRRLKQRKKTVSNMIPEVQRQIKSIRRKLREL